MNMSEFADWLEGEGKRIKDIRERNHGGTWNRQDLITWGDALQWAARKAREKITKPPCGTRLPRRDDGVASWLRREREAWPTGSIQWETLDDLLDDYRLHADTGTPLSEEVEER